MNVMHDSAQADVLPTSKEGIGNTFSCGRLASLTGDDNCVPNDDVKASPTAINPRI